MNPDLYTEEFRNFKYLKSPPWHVEYYRHAFNEVNKIQNWATTNDPLFVWPNRIEFLEQIIDLGQPLYIVYPGMRLSSREYEAATIYTVNDPVIFYGSAVNPQSGKRITLNDIKDIERLSGAYCYLCSGAADGPCINLYNLPVIPTQSSQVDGNISIYTALFYDRATAEMYSSAVTEHIRNNKI
jgi:hypothetical protein